MGRLGEEGPPVPAAEARRGFAVALAPLAGQEPGRGGERAGRRGAKCGSCGRGELRAPSSRPFSYKQLGEERHSRAAIAAAASRWRCALPPLLRLLNASEPGRSRRWAKGSHDLPGTQPRSVSLAPLGGLGGGENMEAASLHGAPPLSISKRKAWSSEARTR